MKLRNEEKQRRGKLLKQLRESHHWTQAECAKRINPEGPNFLRTYQNWEAGETWQVTMEPILEALFARPKGYFSSAKTQQEDAFTINLSQSRESDPNSLEEAFRVIEHLCGFLIRLQASDWEQLKRTARVVDQERGEREGLEADPLQDVERIMKTVIEESPSRSTKKKKSRFFMVKDPYVHVED